MMEAVRTSETSVDNHFTRQYIPEDNSEHEVTCLTEVKEGTGMQKEICAEFGDSCTGDFWNRSPATLLVGD
jgi:hypothetical protein